MPVTLARSLRIPNRPTTPVRDGGVRTAVVLGEISVGSSLALTG